VHLKDTIRVSRRSLPVELDHIPEQCFYMAGGIEDVMEAYEKVKVNV